MKKLIALIAMGFVFSNGAAFAGSECGLSAKTEEQTSTEQIASTEAASVESTETVAQEPAAETDSQEIANTEAQ